MTISDADSKLLWGRAAGLCSNPACNTDLTIILQNDEGYNIGEMAHVIARKISGPRAKGREGADTYANLILLCPTCHRKIDKAPDGLFPEELLHDWKKNHENKIRQLGAAEKFETIESLKSAVTRLLMENHSIWDTLGPKSAAAQNEPYSNLHKLWHFRKLDRIIPNNIRIINIIEQNIDLLTNSDHVEFLKFKLHASSFEQNQYGRVESYPTFPESFAQAFER